MSRTLSRSSASTGGGSGSAQCTPSRGERGYRPESLPLPKKGTSSAPWVLKTKKGGTSQQGNVLRAQVKDFIP